MYSLKSPRRGDSKDQSKLTTQVKQNNFLRLYVFYQRTQNAFERALVHKPSVLEPIKLHCGPGLVCIHILSIRIQVALE